MIGRTPSCFSESPLFKCDCYPVVTNGTHVDALISHGLESKICAAANSVWLCGLRLRADECSVILMPSAWSHTGLTAGSRARWVYSLLECRQLESRYHSHPQDCFKRLSAQEMWHLSSSHKEFILVSVLTKPSRLLCRKHSPFLTTVTMHTCN